MFHFHRWTLWEVTEAGEIIDRSSVKKGSYWIQRRRCEKCGLVQHRREMV